MWVDGRREASLIDSLDAEEVRTSRTLWAISGNEARGIVGMSCSERGSRPA